MKSGIILPALAAVAAAGGAFYSLRAGEQPLLSFSKVLGLHQDHPRVAAVPGEFTQYRYEYRSDGSAPRLFRNGRQVQEGNADDSVEEMHREMEELLKRMGGGDNNGRNPLEDLMRQMRQRSGGDGTGPRGEGGGESPAASRFGKHHRAALAEWRPLVQTARDSTIRIVKDGRQVAFGTVVSADGYALTKASEVNNKDGLECEFHDGRIVSANVVDKLESYDLALIKLAANGLTPAVFSRNDAVKGTLVAAVGVDEDPLAVGVISVNSRSLSEKGKGALGITFAFDADESGKGVLIGEVVKDCPADSAGLKKGDLILAVNGTEVDFPAQLRKLVSDMRPGDPVKVRYTRDGSEGDLEFTLTSRDELIRIQQERSGFAGSGDPRNSLDLTARMGSTLSGNSSGYPNAVQSDLTIDSRDCGGPVVDVDGNVVAINIARAERVSTYMIPGKVVQDLLSNLQSGKFTLAKDEETLRGELREYEAAIRKARDTLKAAEASRGEAEEALKRMRK